MVVVVCQYGCWQQRVLHSRNIFATYLYLYLYNTRNAVGHIQGKTRPNLDTSCMSIHMVHKVLMDPPQHHGGTDVRTPTPEVMCVKMAQQLPHTIHNLIFTVESHSCSDYRAKEFYKSIIKSTKHSEHGINCENSSMCESSYTSYRKFGKTSKKLHIIQSLSTKLDSNHRLKCSLRDCHGERNN